MKVTVLRLVVEVVVLPALLILASNWLAWLHILSEEKLLHGSHLKASCLSQVLVGDLLVLVLI